MQDSNGVLHSVAEYSSHTETPKSETNRFSVTHGPSGLRTPNTSLVSRKRPASPISISEAANLANQELPRKRQRSRNEGLGSSFDSNHAASYPQSRLQICQTSTPITPHIEGVAVIQQRGSPSQRSVPENMTSPREQSISPNDTQEDPPQQSLSPDTETSDGENQDDVARRARPRSRVNDLGIRVTTPPRAADDLQHDPSDIEQRIRPRPNALDTAAAQDLSLPSPSLSPVTAAANLQNRTGYFEEHPVSLQSADSSFNFQEAQKVAPSLWSAIKQSESSQTDPEAGALMQPSSAMDRQGFGHSMSELLTIVDSFGAWPKELQTYMMYQFLRRCPKPVLHFVSDVVNPALKCDFLSLLPLELCLNIVSNLDLKSLCCAAQVSRKWRGIIDSDEKTWKRLFDADGYVLPAGELNRAMREGWGWQFASRSDDWEKDLGSSGIEASETNVSMTALHANLLDSDTAAALSSQLETPQTRRSKKKAASKPKGKNNSRKQQKRVESQSSSVLQLDTEALIQQTSSPEGPNAAANFAMMYVANPHVGIPSLRNMHLYKSIYQRHHAIRKSWMQDEIKPRHIAFRAHQRHVVTCLQFDADKILTGSDDTNINVYNTKTGAIISRLEGHEGGVWALQYEGNILVSGSTDRSVRVWDIARAECTHVFQGHTSTVRCLQILMPTMMGKTSDGRAIMMPKQPLIITGSRDSNLRIWKLPKEGDKSVFQAGPPADETECPYFVRVLTGHHHSVRAIAAHADTLVSGSYDCTVRVWKISTGETLHRLAGHTQKVYSVVLDHKRNRCISGSMDNLVKVWSLDAGQVLYNLEGHSSLVGLLDLQQDRLVSAAADSTLRIWDPETGHCKSTLSAHTGAITCFQHDGQKVISGSDRTLKMWNVTNGEFVRDLLTDLSGVWQVKFNERKCVAAVQRNNLTYIEVEPHIHNSVRYLANRDALGLGFWRLQRRRPSA